MATYAVLGATGNCGRAIIELLLDNPDANINAYCRDGKKLLRVLPVVERNKQVEIFVGSIEDVDLLARCVHKCAVVFLLASTNDNVPGYHVSQDLARGVVAALKQLRAESESELKMPRLVLLSSASTDEHLSRDHWFLKPILERAVSNVYNDLRQAETFLRAQESWVSTIFIKPGALSIDKQRGHKISLDEVGSWLSYFDLAAAMLEAADDLQGRYDMVNVSVVNTNGPARFPSGTPMCLLLGLLRHFLPFMHPYLPSGGPV